MKKISILFLTISFLTVSSCKKIIDSASSLGKEDLKIEELKAININEEYTISVPEYMTEMKSLNEEASLGYANLFKETYIIVLDEDKDEFISAFKDVEIYNDSLTPLQNYSDFQLESFKENIVATNLKSLVSKIKKLPSEMHEFNGDAEGNDIAYLVSFIESDKKMYMIMSWTLKDRYNKYKETFKLTHSTFKLKD
jgi:hypothetical protein